MSRKLFFLLSPSAVLFYFLFTVRVPHKKTINLLFTDHQEIVSRRGLFTTHVSLVPESKWCTLYDWRALKCYANDTILSPIRSISRHQNKPQNVYCSMNIEVVLRLLNKCPQTAIRAGLCSTSRLLANQELTTRSKWVNISTHYQNIIKS